MARLATHIWVQAQVRICDLHFLPAVVTHRGDANAGTVVVRIVRGPNRNLLLRRHTTGDGALAWMAVGTPPGRAVAPAEAFIDDAAADAYIGRERGRDPDLWVLEVEDFQARYWPDQPIGE